MQLSAMIIGGDAGLDSQSKRWDRLAYTYDRDREIASRAYLDLIAGHRTRDVDRALKTGLGSPMVIEVPYVLALLMTYTERGFLTQALGEASIHSGSARKAHRSRELTVVRKW